MHSLVGYWLGDDTAHAHGRITLNPLKHIDPVTTVALPMLLIALGFPPFAAAKPVPINMHRLKFQEFGMALVGIAGPLTNLLLAIIFALLARLAEPGGWLMNFILMNVSINVGLIPFPPLDGSRVLYALAPDFIQKIMMQIEQLGFTAILLFMFIGVPVISPVIISTQHFILNTLL